MSELEKLEERVAKLEYHIRQLLLCLDAERCPREAAIVWFDLSWPQVRAFYQLLDATDVRLRQGHKPPIDDFYRQVQAIIPSVPPDAVPIGDPDDPDDHDDYDYVAQLVVAFCCPYAGDLPPRRWRMIYGHLQEHGKISPRRP